MLTYLMASQFSASRSKMENGQQDMNALHQAGAVQEGEKYIMIYITT